MNPTYPAFRLETPRLVLRPFVDRDIAPFSQYRSDPEVAQYQGWEAPYSLEQAARFIAGEKIKTPGDPAQWFQVAIELKSSGALIGDCAFQRLTEDDHQAEIGFTLARPYQGRGYAAEAVSRLLEFLFNNLGLHRVRANCDSANTTSARLMQRVGMRHEGRFIESLWFKGRWADEDWYAILQNEWAANRTAAMEG